MVSSLSTNILKHAKDSFCWTQPLIHINPDGNVIVNLTKAVGVNARVQSNAPDQPDHYLSFDYQSLLGVIEKK